MGKHKGKSENVHVILRVRPLNAKEKEGGNKEAVHVSLGDNSVSVDGAGVDGRQWGFDAVYNNSFTQKDVYLQSIHPVVESVLQGFNGTIFAYGQSGTGKTYSMCGSLDSPEKYGIIPNALNHVFTTIGELRSDKMEYYTQISFVELYNGKCRDLLVDGRLNLELKENVQKLFYVKDLSMWPVSSVKEAMELMEQGLTRRETKATELNSDSSRSHSLYTLYIRTWDKEEDLRTESKLNLVDLAGSERQKQANTTGEALREGCNINLSLTALGTVIDCLVKNKPHIPYRSSMLTMLLKDGLGGNSRTVLVGTISPSEGAAPETVSTLRFIDRAKQIKNKPKVQMDPKDAKIAELLEEIKRLRRQLGLDEEFESDEEGVDAEERKERIKKSKSIIMFDDEMEALRRRCEELEVQVEMSHATIEDTQQFEKDFAVKEAQLRKNFSEQENGWEARLSELNDTNDLLRIASENMERQYEQLRHLCVNFLSTLDKDDQWRSTLSDGPDDSIITIDDIAHGFKMVQGNGVDMRLHALPRRSSILRGGLGQQEQSVRRTSDAHGSQHSLPPRPHPPAEVGPNQYRFCRSPAPGAELNTEGEESDGGGKERKRHKKHKRHKGKKEKASREGRPNYSSELPVAVIDAALAAAGFDADAPVRSVVADLLAKQRLHMHEQQQARLLAAGSGEDGGDNAELRAAVEELTDEVATLTETIGSQKQQLEKIQSVAEKRLQEISQHKEHIDALRAELSKKQEQHQRELDQQQDQLVQQHNKKMEALVNKHTKALTKERKQRDALQKKIEDAVDERSELLQQYDVKIMELEELQHSLEEHKIETLKQYRSHLSPGYASLDLNSTTSTTGKMMATIRRELESEERQSRGQPNVEKLRAAVRGTKSAEFNRGELAVPPVELPRSSGAHLFSRNMLDPPH